MKTWLSTGSGRGFFEALIAGDHKYYLGSFIEGPALTRWMQEMLTPNDFAVFLDSGAYSAWSRGAQIDLDEYCAFIKANIEHIHVYANLDHIAGAPGKHASRSERNAGAAKSWENYLYMREQGLDPIPVYHIGEDWSWCQKMLDYGCPYIGLGGLVGVPSARRRQWLDDVFSKITDDAGRPVVKTHGFGMTSIPLLFRYPWYSVDSTTWIQVSANGSIYLPAKRGGAFVFDEVPSIISTSDRSPGRALTGNHVDGIPRIIQEAVEEWLAMCGVTLQQCREHYGARATVNACFFRFVSEAKLSGVFAFRQRGTKGLW